jgi:hypothetical protein
MVKGKYVEKQVKELNDIEFLATLHQQEKESLFILKSLRNWMKRKEFDAGQHSTHMVAYWSKKADELFENKLPNRPIEIRPFKSLMQQLADGELSHRLKS